MKFTLSWLKEHLETDAPLKDILDTLTMIGLEVEEVDDRAALQPFTIAKVIEAISGGAAQSWQMDNRWETMRDGHYEHGFAVDWMRKDLRIALDTARTNGASVPLTAMVDQYYADIQSMGGNRWDTSSLLARLGRSKG